MKKGGETVKSFRHASSLYRVEHGFRSLSAAACGRCPDEIDVEASACGGTGQPASGIGV